MGPVGHGQAIKVIGNVCRSSNAVILAQSLIAASASGIDLEKAIEVLKVSSGASTMLDLKARPMLEHDWTTLFKLEHMLKDVRLALEQAHEARVPYPAAADARPSSLEGGMARGLADADFASVLEVLEGLGWAASRFPPNGWGYLDIGVFVCNDACTLPRHPEAVLIRATCGTFVVLNPNLSFLCQLPSRNGRSPSGRSPKASSW